MRTDSEQAGMTGADEFKDYPIFFINAKCPYLLALGFNLLCIQRWMKWILTEQFFLFLGFLFDCRWQSTVSLLKLIRVVDLDHTSEDRAET